jgi:hypothetical protein
MQQDRAQGADMNQTRKPRPDLTKEELERLEKYGSIDFKSAGATRQR